MAAAGAVDARRGEGAEARPSKVDDVAVALLVVKHDEAARERRGREAPHMALEQRAHELTREACRHETRYNSLRCISRASRTAAGGSVRRYACWAADDALECERARAGSHAAEHGWCG